MGGTNPPGGSPAPIGAAVAELRAGTDEAARLERVLEQTARMLESLDSVGEPGVVAAQLRALDRMALLALPPSTLAALLRHLTGAVQAFGAVVEAHRLVGER